MEVLAVFRNGRWIQYVPRITLLSDPRITGCLQQKATSVYVTALQKGFQEERAHTLAEAVVFKDIYSELEFEKDLESDIRRLMDRGEKA